MKSLLRIVVLFFALHLNAQDTTRFICSFPAMPEFPGGEQAFRKYLQDNIHYPPSEKEQGIQGVVFVYFEVSPTGKIENARIQRGIEHGGALNAEALRVIAAMPDWIPAKVDGKPQRTAMTQPVQFTLDNGPAPATQKQSDTSSSGTTFPPRESVQPVDSNAVLHYAEVMPVFPGGNEARIKYIADNIVYPEKEKAEGKTGTVYVRFTVNRDGSVSDVTVVRQARNGAGFNAEAIRVVSSMPNWTPGMMNGKTVRVSMVVPVKFMLSPEPEKKQ